MSDRSNGFIGLLVGGIIVFLIFWWREQQAGNNALQSLANILSGKGANGGGVGAGGANSSSACEHAVEPPVTYDHIPAEDVNSDEGRGIFSIEGGTPAGETSYFGSGQNSSGSSYDVSTGSMVSLRPV